jgi:hypothetical protein
MANECELLNTCQFFKKYNETKNLACKGFIASYCRGPKMNQCQRMEYRKKNNCPPSDDMMPNGQIIVSV